MDKHHNIEEYPSISLEVSFNGTRGWVRLSALYGSHLLESEYPFSPDTQVKLFCPHCHIQLIGETNCIDCGYPMVPLKIKGGGSLFVCARWGCANRVLNVNGMNPPFETNTKEISTGH